MNEMIKMVVVLTVLSAVSGGLLAAVHNGTTAQIENQQLKFVKGPAIKSILAGCSNDPIADRFKLKDGDIERNFFVGKFDGEANTVVFEGVGKGFGGDLGIMVGVNLKSDDLVGAAVTTHSETPGLGAKAKDDPAFSSQFKGLPIANPAAIAVSSDGGKINAISGATITSRAVCAAVAGATKVYQKMKPEIQEKMKAYAN